MRHHAIPAILILAALSSGSCGKSSGTAGGGAVEVPDRPKDIADAAKLVEIGQCETAVEKLKAFVSTHPEEREAYLVLGDAWTCRAFAKTKSGGDKDSSALEGAAAAYESLLKLSPKDVRALVSRAAIAVFEHDKETAKPRLEEALSVEPKHKAAANLLAILTESDAPLKAAYAERKPTAVPSPPEPCSPQGECESGIILETTELAGKRYAAGTVLGKLEKDAGGVAFSDRVYPDRKSGQGWALTKVEYNSGGAFAKLETRSVASPKQARVLANRVPDLARAYRPGTGPQPETEANQAARSARDRWRPFAYDSGGARNLEDALGVVSDVVPETVTAAGAPLKVSAITNAYDHFEASVEFAFEFTPVAFEQLLATRRTVPAKSVAGFSVREEAAKTLSGTDLLGPDEKRALLVRQLFPGVPLFFAYRARGYRLREGTLELRNGNVTLTFPLRGGADTYVNGELTSTTSGEAKEQDPKRGRGKEAKSLSGRGSP